MLISYVKSTEAKPCVQGQTRTFSKVVPLMSHTRFATNFWTSIGPAYEDKRNIIWKGTGFELGVAKIFYKRPQQYCGGVSQLARVKFKITDIRDALNYCANFTAHALFTNVTAARITNQEGRSLDFHDFDSSCMSYKLLINKKLINRSCLQQNASSVTDSLSEISHICQLTSQDTAAPQLIYLCLDFSVQQFKVVSHFYIKILFVSVYFCSGFIDRAFWDCSFESRRGLDICPF